MIESIQHGVNNQSISTQQYFLRRQLVSPSFSAFPLGSQPRDEFDCCHDRPIQPCVRLWLVAMNTRQFKTVLLKQVTQFRVSDRIHMCSNLYSITVFSPQSFCRCAGNWFEMRSVAVKQPFQTLFDIENVRHADDQMPARL